MRTVRSSLSTQAFDRVRGQQAWCHPGRKRKECRSGVLRFAGQPEGRGETQLHVFADALSKILRALAFKVLGSMG